MTDFHRILTSNRIANRGFCIRRITSSGSVSKAPIAECDRFSTEAEAVSAAEKRAALNPGRKYVAGSV